MGKVRREKISSDGSYSFWLEENKARQWGVMRVGKV